MNADNDAGRPRPLKVPERRRTVSLGGLRQFRETLGSPPHQPMGMLREAGVSPTTPPVTIGSSLPSSGFFGLPMASPSESSSASAGGGGTSLSGLLRRASWIEGSSNTSSSNHLFASLPARMKRPGVLGHADTSLSPTSPISPSFPTPPDTTAGPFVKTRSEGTISPVHSPQPAQAPHPRVSALSAFLGAGHKVGPNTTAKATTTSPERPATPMGNMILSGQFLD
ncbi:hypothetical protein THASP1DRAFT_30295 [Thamnocephalis sphaerospora]|uniref:Uncharacterized protein n=1 Tax=Thamnocephalis sphaerospora TaxID=78915 RepID=A0A4V1IWK7_9FUNG|nr:hypothetical protein THASP1DRAFT_30295 [Thamnocephalis sphaerospora]|eukprot:RKP07899.1 hypothetical protein THASP1DRAFT_30295 [Thamnocephalis sphaerospora]